MDKRIKLAIGLGSTCAGCDIAILDLKEKILDLASLAEIVFWPTAMDFKLSDLERIGKNDIDISLQHGTIRTSEQEHIAHLLRERSKVMIAFGSCSCFEVSLHFATSPAEKRYLKLCTKKPLLL